MKDTFKKTALCVLALAALITGGAAVSDRDGANAVPAQSAPAASAGGYCLRDWQGYVAVFEGGSETPSEMTDIPTGTLNLVDREKLRCGIDAGTREELLSLLEDFSS